MSMTLSLVDHLYARARKLENLGMLPEACRAYQRLLNMTPMAAKLRHEIAGRLGGLQLERGQFARSRQSLQLALTLKPDHAEHQHLLAQAVEADENCALEQADQPYQRCVQLEPNNPLYLVDHARHLFNRGRCAEALSTFRQAFEVGGDDPAVVGDIVTGLRELGEMDEAQQLLRLARFRHARDPRFRRLWNDQQFQMLWAGQQAALGATEEETVPILRFVGPSRPAAQGEQNKGHGQRGRALA